MNFDFNQNKYNNRGLSGIINYGNTCYINSAIQALSHTLGLTHFFLSDDFKKHINLNDKNQTSIDFTIQWVKLLRGLWEDNCTVSPKSFFKILVKISNEKNIDLNMSFNVQNDIQEFIMLVLNLFHDAFKTDLQEKKNNKIFEKEWYTFFKNDYSVIVDLFYGQVMTKLKNIDNDKIVSTSYQPVCFFALPVTVNECNIYDCIDLYLKDELISLAIDNEETTVRKSITVTKFPNILIITLNRFDSLNNKINSVVDIPEILDMSRYSKKPIEYDLYTICNHTGSCNSGHYTSYCKNNNKWYEFNDNTVIKLKELNKTNAYCLFYKKR